MRGGVLVFKRFQVGQSSRNPRRQQGRGGKTRPAGQTLEALNLSAAASVDKGERERASELILWTFSWPEERGWEGDDDDRQALFSSLSLSGPQEHMLGSREIELDTLGRMYNVHSAPILRLSAAGRIFFSSRGQDVEKCSSLLSTLARLACGQMGGAALLSFLSSRPKLNMPRLGYVPTMCVSRTATEIIQSSPASLARARGVLQCTLFSPLSLAFFGPTPGRPDARLYVVHTYIHCTVLLQHTQDAGKQSVCGKKRSTVHIHVAAGANEA